MPSLLMSPWGSASRNRALTSKDFPAPVLPTTPTFGEEGREEGGEGGGREEEGRSEG